MLQKGEQQLELHLESVLATYHLNQEKLSYNVLLLEQKNAENAAALVLHRARHNKCREVLTKITTKFRSEGLGWKEENLQGTAECRRLQKQYDKLWRGLDQSVKANQVLFKQLWKHHEDEVGDLSTRVVEADKLIHSRYLGHLYTPPGDMEGERQLSWTGTAEEDEFEGSSTNFGVARSSSSSRQRNSSNRKTESLQSAMQRRSSSSRCSNSSDLKPFSSNKINRALQLLRHTCWFLLDNHHRELPESLSEEQRSFLQILQLLEVVGVESKGDLFTLIDLFYKGQDFDDDSLYADADDVLKILEEFQEVKMAADLNVAKQKRDRRGTRKEPQAEALERLKAKIRKRWQAFTDPLPPQRQKLLLSLYQTYLAELQRLSRLSKELLQQQVSSVSLQQLVRQVNLAAAQQQQQQVQQVQQQQQVQQVLQQVQQQVQQVQQGRQQLRLGEKIHLLPATETRLLQQQQLLLLLLLPLLLPRLLLLAPSTEQGRGFASSLPTKKFRKRALVGAMSATAAAAAVAAVAVAAVAAAQASPAAAAAAAAACTADV
ncbi:hypothetical protein Esti_004329 [Eimeria stiedai]